MRIGEIIKLKDTYGFISYDKGDTIFFHKSSVENNQFYSLQINDIVMFSKVPSKKHKGTHEAENIKIYKEEILNLQLKKYGYIDSNEKCNNLFLLIKDLRRFNLIQEDKIKNFIVENANSYYQCILSLKTNIGLDYDSEYALIDLGIQQEIIKKSSEIQRLDIF